MPSSGPVIRAILAGLATVAAACGTVEGDPADASSQVDAALSDAAPADASPVACTPSTTTCTGGVLLVCDASGSGEPATCPLGCHASASRCNDLEPSNGLGAVLDMAATGDGVTLADGITIDTSTGMITRGNTSIVLPSLERPAGPNGVALRVYRVKSLVIGSAVVTGDRALAFVSDGPIEIRGTIDISGAHGGAGSLRGAALPCAGSAPASAPMTGTTYLQAGGGGGGFGSAGATGGDAGTPALRSPGAAGGVVAGDGTLTPLRGGCPGGGAVINNLAVGGDGGGALHLVSRTAIRLVSSGVTPGFIDAGGEGGTGAANETRYGNAGTGGGSGGAILLEAPAVSLVSNTGLAANGGAGGCGRDQGEGVGQNGLRTTAAAAGAVCTAKAGRGNGGSGASAAVPVAAVGADGVNAGGGGGGGLGRIVINNATGTFEAGAGSTLSPPASLGQVGVR